MSADNFLDIDVARKTVVGQYVRFLWRYDEPSPEEGDDTAWHRVVDVSLGDNHGVPTLVYHIPHRRGVHDNTVQNCGHVGVEVTSERPRRGSVCQLCFPEAFSPSAPV